MCWSAGQVYINNERAPGLGRQFCTEQLNAALTHGPGRDDLVHDAALIVSELLTNALRARSRVTRLSLAVHRDRVRVMVDDDAPGQPKVRAPSPRESSGRGMLIVESIASSWSVEGLIPGKQVWAELDLPPELTVDLPSCHRPTRFTPIAPVNPGALS
jgi:anti-sigma regulatory factor (Ser/Thr protein kinase)